MRLAELLSRAPDTSRAQVESFIGSRSVRWNKHLEIKVGKVARNYFCRQCDNDRTFASGEALSCLVTSANTVSIDVSLRCMICESQVEAWFLVGSDDSLDAPSPWMHLERFTENRRDVAGRPGSQAGHVDDLFARAQIAFEDGLGAGGIIYLRKIFEMVTTQAAGAIGVSTKGPRGRSKSFRSLLEEVDKLSHIVPEEFSKDGYRLFSELSGVIHGAANESTALTKYEPCRELVLGIVDNVRTKQAMRAAAAALGWENSSGTTAPPDGPAA